MALTADTTTIPRIGLLLLVEANRLNDPPLLDADELCAVVDTVVEDHRPSSTDAATVRLVLSALAQLKVEMRRAHDQKITEHDEARKR